APPPVDSFPTRRSSDLLLAGHRRQRLCGVSLVLPYPAQLVADDGQQPLFPVVPRPLNQLLHRSAVWLLVQLYGALPLGDAAAIRSEEHTSELQSRENLV